MIFLLQEVLESKICELEASILQMQKTERRDKQEIAKLQKQLSKVCDYLIS